MDRAPGPFFDQARHGIIFPEIGQRHVSRTVPAAFGGVKAHQKDTSPLPVILCENGAPSEAFSPPPGLFLPFLSMSPSTYIDRNASATCSNASAKWSGSRPVNLAGRKTTRRSRPLLARKMTAVGLQTWRYTVPRAPLKKTFRPNTSPIPVTTCWENWRCAVPAGPFISTRTTTWCRFRASGAMAAHLAEQTRAAGSTAAVLRT